MSEREQILDRIREQLGDAIRRERMRSERRAYFDIPPDAVPSATRVLFEKLGARFQIASGSAALSRVDLVFQRVPHEGPVPPRVSIAERTE